MDEKITFKNQEMAIGFENGKPAWYSPSRYAADGKPFSGKFRTDEWDMEVTFTKKEKPFAPGFFRYTANPTSNFIGHFNSPPAYPENWKRVNVTDAE